MTFNEICPDCMNPVTVYENGDGTANGQCMFCGRSIAYTHTGYPQEEKGQQDGPTVKHRTDDLYYPFIEKGKAYEGCGSYDTLQEAERACTTFAKKGQRCFVENQHKTVSEWIDGERADLKRKFIKVWFEYDTYEEHKSGSSTVVTTQDRPTYKAIEYYLLKHSFKVTRYVVTDDDGKVIEEKKEGSA